MSWCSTRCRPATTASTCRRDCASSAASPVAISTHAGACWEWAWNCRTASASCIWPVRATGTARARAGWRNSGAQIAGARGRRAGPSVAVDVLQLHLEAAGIAALAADPADLLGGGVRAAVDRAGGFAVSAHADLAQAVARMPAAAVGRVVHGGLAGLQVQFAVVD